MTALSSDRRDSVCRSLLGWYGAHGRQLPWRQTQEPYRIWISEIMLQQTQVQTVLPRYDAWFAQFPSIAALAAASIDDVMKAWEGLGYYRRARFIHAAAQQIMARFDGAFPHDWDDLLALPGIGRSTAGAIASFAFGAVRPVLDGNVKRVLRRWHGQMDVRDAQLWAWAEAWIAASNDAASWNQAMMELGAVICTARRAQCECCPVAAQCASAFAVESAAQSRRAPVQDRYWQLQLHRCARRGIWLTQRPAAGIWGGLWSPPIVELDAAPDSAPIHLHQLTHRRLHLYVQERDDAPSGEGCWVRDPAELATPTGVRRTLEKWREGVAI